VDEPGMDVSKEGEGEGPARQPGGGEIRLVLFLGFLLYSFSIFIASYFIMIYATMLTVQAP
jgi:hypothetical protein